MWSAAETLGSTSLTKKAAFYAQPRDPSNSSSTGAPTDMFGFATSINHNNLISSIPLRQSPKNVNEDDCWLLIVDKLALHY